MYFDVAVRFLPLAPAAAPAVAAVLAGPRGLLFGAGGAAAAANGAANGSGSGFGSGMGQGRGPGSGSGPRPGSTGTGPGSDGGLQVRCRAALSLLRVVEQMGPHALDLLPLTGTFAGESAAFLLSSLCLSYCCCYSCCLCCFCSCSCACACTLSAASPFLCFCLPACPRPPPIERCLESSAPADQPTRAGLCVSGGMKRERSNGGDSTTQQFRPAAAESPRLAAWARVWRWGGHSLCLALPRLALLSSLAVSPSLSLPASPPPNNPPPLTPPPQT